MVEMTVASKGWQSVAELAELKAAATVDKRGDNKVGSLVAASAVEKAVVLVEMMVASKDHPKAVELVELRVSSSVVQTVAWKVLYGAVRSAALMVELTVVKKEDLSAVLWAALMVEKLVDWLVELWVVLLVERLAVLWETLQKMSTLKQHRQNSYQKPMSCQYRPKQKFERSEFSPGCYLD